MALKDFEASDGSVQYLTVAREKAMIALVQGHNLDVKLSAATIAVSAGYIASCKVSELLHTEIQPTLNVRYAKPIEFC